MAISAFGTASDFVARYALEKIGLTPGKDVALVQVGVYRIDWERFWRGESKPPCLFLRRCSSHKKKD